MVHSNCSRRFEFPYGRKVKLEIIKYNKGLRPAAFEDIGLINHDECFLLIMKGFYSEI